MAFKTLNTYNEERYGKFFILKNDGDTADVIFLYQSTQDALVADTHYIKSADYDGYVHCTGRGCPACSKGIRVQTKLFIPVYNFTSNQIEFWDRSTRFEPQLQNDVFKNYPNPSEFVFRITRRGASGDVNTVYEITAVAKNTFKPYAQILADCGTSMPAGYNDVCRDITAGELAGMLNNNDAASGSSMPDYSGYGATPRPAANPIVPTPSFTEPPVDVPGVSSDAAMNGFAEDEEDPQPNF